jgi:hypothetical protein
LLIPGIYAGRAHLLKLPQSSDELLHESQVRSQPPEQKEQQQG